MANSAFLMIFAVFDPSPLTVCINCSFLHISQIYIISSCLSLRLTQNKGYYAVQGHSRSTVLVPIESSRTFPICD